MERLMHPEAAIRSPPVKAQSLAELERRAAVAELLLETGRAVTSTLDRSEVLKLVARRAARAVDVDRCSLLLLDASQERLLPIMSQFASGEGSPELWQRFRESTPQRVEEAPLTRRVIAERRPAVLEDPFREDLLPRRWTEAFGIRRLLLVPLVSRDRVIGLMALDYCHSDRHFSPDQIELASALAAHTAMAIENASLYQTERQARSKLEEMTRSLELEVEGRTAALGEAQRSLARSEREAFLGRAAASFAQQMQRSVEMLSGTVGLLYEAAPAGDPRVTEHIDALDREVKRLGHQIAALGSLQETGDALLEQVDVRVLLGQVLETDPPPQGIRVATHWEGDVHLLADAEQLRSAFLAVLENAYQAMPRGGLLAAAVRGRLEWVEVRIMDTGLGIPAEVLERVFEPFFTTKPAALGLGLTTTRLLVERHGGSVHVSSQGSRGTTVTLTLPRRAPGA